MALLRDARKVAHFRFQSVGVSYSGSQHVKVSLYLLKD